VCASFHFYPLRLTFGVPWWLSGQESAVSAGDTVSNLPWVGKILKNKQESSLALSIVPGEVLFRPRKTILGPK